MKGLIFIEDEEIGYSDFEVIDESMGAIGGVFNTSENYQKFKQEVIQLYNKKGSANSTNSNFRIVINNNELKPEGGICLTDNGEDDIYVDAAGIDLSKI